MLVIIGVTLHCLMRRKKKRKKNSNRPYVAGLEDLIEMRTRTQSGGADSRGNRELGKNGALFVPILTSSFLYTYFLKFYNSYMLHTTEANRFAFKLFFPVLAPSLA